MARPNNSAAIGEWVRGMREAKAAFQAMPEVVRNESLIATTDTVKAIAASAKARILSSPSVLTRSLLNAVTWSINKKNGRGKAGVQNVTSTVSAPGGSVGKATIKVRGIVVAGKGGSASKSAGAKIINPRRYAHLVEFGTRHSKEEPFMMPSAEGQRGPYLDRMMAAGRRSEIALAHGSTRSGSGSGSGTGLL